MPKTAINDNWNPTVKIESGENNNIIIQAHPSDDNPSYGLPKTLAINIHDVIIKALTTDDVKSQTITYKNKTKINIILDNLSSIWQSEKIIDNSNITNPTCRPETASRCEIPAFWYTSLILSFINSSSPNNIPYAIEE